MQIVCAMLSLYSVGSTVTSERPERYERLTSVSSSVDFEQKDTVRLTLFVLDKTLFLEHNYAVIGNE